MEHSTGATTRQFALLKKPLITEKTAGWLPDNSVAFVVDRTASKTDVRNAVEAVFSVKVAKVRTTIIQGKVKRVRGRSGRRVSIKKAFVTLAPGYSIDLVEGL